MKYFIGILLILVVFLYQTAWFGPARTWQEASGWNSISNEDKQKHFHNNVEYPKIFWLGHAGFLIEWNSTKLLLDPNLSETSVIVHRETKSFIKPSELPAIDGAIISHAHYDHLDIPTLEGIKKLSHIILAEGSDVFLPQSLREKSKVIGLGLWKSISLNGIEITSVPAVHNGSRNHPFESVYRASGYILSDGKIKIYFAGDTGWGEHFEEIKNRYFPQISIIPIGGFEPYFILKNYHLNPEDAAKAAQLTGAGIVIPSHFGTFRVALDYPQTALPRFIKASEELKINWQIAQPFKP